MKKARSWRNSPTLSRLQPAKSTCAETQRRHAQGCAGAGSGSDGSQLGVLHRAPARSGRSISVGFLALNARILALAERDGLPLMTICNTTTLNLIDANAILAEDADLARQVNLRFWPRKAWNTEAPPASRIFCGCCLKISAPERLRRQRVVNPLTGSAGVAGVLRLPYHATAGVNTDASIPATTVRSNCFPRSLGCARGLFRVERSAAASTPPHTTNASPSSSPDSISSRPRSAAHRRWLHRARSVTPCSTASRKKSRRTSARS